MSHPSDDSPLNENIAKAMRELVSDPTSAFNERMEARAHDLAALGATGRYPDGTYGPNDEGELQFAIAADPESSRVLIDFGKPVRSIGMLPEHARALAAALREKADQAEKS